VPWQFHIIDGADQGRTFGLPEAGINTVGSSRKHADIHLNDLYVARIHAEVEVEGERVTLTAHDSPAGTLVNGQKIQKQEIRHGDVVRMGNSHLRLEDVALAAVETPEAEVDDLPVFEIEVLPEEDPAPAAQVEGRPAAAAVTPNATNGVAREEAAPALEEHGLPVDHLPDLAGQTLAHFQVEKVIGTGQSGVVFLAHDLKTHQAVALKVLASDFPNNDGEMQRFVQVWKAVLPLRHPNLVSLYGVGRASPFCWLAMELVENASLPEMIERLRRLHTIHWHDAYRVALQIGAALAFAHQHHVVHRNVTARNILWRTSDKVAKLADLGLEAALHDSALSRITLRDKLQAELVYLSPEQTRPGCFVDGVCDIYSLGVVIYAMLTGHYPFTGSSQADIVRKIRESEPARPTSLQPDIPKRLENIVLRMLAKSHEDRYQTAEALVSDLERVGREEGLTV
jgi:hypothetical protein